MANSWYKLTLDFSPFYFIAPIPSFSSSQSCSLNELLLISNLHLRFCFGRYQATTGTISIIFFYIQLDLMLLIITITILELSLVFLRKTNEQWELELSSMFITCPRECKPKEDNGALLGQDHQRYLRGRDCSLSYACSYPMPTL